MPRNWKLRVKHDIELGYLADLNKMGKNTVYIYVSHNAYLYTNTQVSLHTYESNGFHDNVHVV